MSPAEWEIVARWLGGLWPPMLDSNGKAAYFEVLESFSAAEVRGAIDTLAKTTREKRPPAGVIYATIRAGQESARPTGSEEAPKRDVLTPAQHRMAQIDLAKVQSAEHARRMKAVLALGRRLSFATLSTLLPQSSCSAEEFDRRLAELAGGPDEPLAVGAPASRRGHPGRLVRPSGR